MTLKVKALAESKKFVYDEDLLTLVSGAPNPWAKLIRYQCLSGNSILPTATIELLVDGEVKTASACGNGPLDSALKAIDQALGMKLELVELTTRAVTGGKGAMAEVLVRVRHEEIETIGQAASTDTIEASLKAYLSAVVATRSACVAA